MLEIKDLYWVAGLIEGEGCFTFRQNKYIGIQVRMCDEDVVRKLYNVLGIGIVHGPYTPWNKKHSPSWQWAVNKQQEAAALMMTIYLLMGERRQQEIEERLEVWLNIPIGRAKLTHCKWGHEFTRENSKIINERGHRTCRECNRIRQREYLERKEDYYGE